MNSLWSLWLSRVKRRENCIWTHLLYPPLSPFSQVLMEDTSESQQMAVGGGGQCWTEVVVSLPSGFPTERMEFPTPSTTHLLDSSSCKSLPFTPYLPQGCASHTLFLQW